MTPKMQHHFSPADVAVIHCGLSLYRHMNLEEVERPEFFQLERWFNPTNRGVARLPMKQRHLLLIVQVVGLVYGLTSTDCTAFARINPALTPSMMPGAESLIDRLVLALKLRGDLSAQKEAWRQLALGLSAEATEELPAIEGSFAVRLDVTPEELEQLKIAATLAVQAKSAGASLGTPGNAEAAHAVQMAYDALTGVERDDLDWHVLMAGLLTVATFLDDPNIAGMNDLMRQLGLDRSLLASAAQKIRTALDPANWTPIARGEA